MKRIERHIFLILAILAAGLSAGCYWLLERDAPGATDEQYLSAVQQRVKEEMLISSDELQQISGLVANQKTFNFSTLSIDTKYPYYIFSNGALIVWSDYRFIPDFDKMRQVVQPKLIEFDRSRYLVSHKRIRKGSDTVDVFSLINVYRHFLSDNTYLQSGYNSTLLALDPAGISDRRQQPYQAIYDHESVFLFSVEPPRVNGYRNSSTPVNTVTLAAIGFLFLGLYIVRQLIRLGRRRQHVLAFSLLATYLIVLRGLMLYFGVPFLFIEWDLFNPKFYAASVLTPSLGDLLLNLLVLIVLALYWVNYYYKSTPYTNLLRLPPWAKAVVSVGIVVLSYVVFAFCYAELTNIYEKSQFTLDITLSIHFSFLKIICLLIFIGVSALYFLLIHLLASVFFRFNRPVSWVRGGGLVLAGTVIMALISWLFDLPLSIIYAVNGLYFLLIYAAGFPRMLYTFRYKTSIYLFMAAFFCALTTAYVVYEQEVQKQLAHEQAFAAQLLAENDKYGEFMLSKAQESIVSDPEIGRSLRQDTLLVRERIQQRIKSLHLSKYFDKYDIQVSSFGASGQSLDMSQGALSLAGLQAKYQKPDYKTNYPGIYFVNEADNKFVKQYVGFITIPAPKSLSGSNPTGYIILDMRLRSQRSRGVYPELLADARFSKSPDEPEYSYAVYQRIPGKPGLPQLLYCSGRYNYDRKMPVELLDDPALPARGVSANGYRHVAQQGRDGRLVVVSADEYPLANIFSNFSFLYLLLVFTVILIIILYAIKYQFTQFRINYSTRIQILLNVAFFLPLISVIILILSVISSNYTTNQENSYVSNTRNIAANFLTYIDEHLVAQKRSKASMEEELSKIARDADIDINLFDTQGKLYTSTRPLMYESGYLSKRINPAAYIRIIEEKENQILLNESLGDKTYRTAYAGIKSYDGRLLGVLSVPYFYASTELERQIIEVIAMALSIFTGLFLFFLVVSYFASHVLTRPLQMLTQKIRKTNLDHPNDPLPWQSDDEIGLLIREYNRMLVKLEESKQELAQNEKQSAWREMAKQVAHEIKNPLTPMKLTLQHLQRTFPKTVEAEGTLNGAGSRVIQRTFDSLLDQIDNLSDIATSFSEFAKMPLPKNETFEITVMLNKAADLYAERTTLYRQIAPGPIMVIGDRQLIGRILTNLLINAIQSVPPDRRAVINLQLYTNDDEVQIEVRDNGAGIPDALHTKVFLLNFSTKTGGSGLGLAIAKRGIEHAGGNIWFETVEGVGTSFFVSLPLASVQIPVAASALN